MGFNLVKAAVIVFMISSAGFGIILSVLIGNATLEAIAFGFFGGLLASIGLSITNRFDEKKPLPPTPAQPTRAERRPTTGYNQPVKRVSFKDIGKSYSEAKHETDQVPDEIPLMSD